ncbi:MAG: hypothetical protein H6974_12170 [Gammaproteobacteria bacterium]|nr:hypothetical protein [Gammaproteobacteria bacterium]
MNRKVVEFHKPGLILSKKEIFNFSKSWLEHEQNEIAESSSMSAADEALTFGAKNNPDICLDIILEICKLTNDSEILVTLGVGVLEDLMSLNGMLLESRVIEAFRENNSFKIALSSVYLTEDDDGYQMVKKLIGEYKYL